MQALGKDGKCTKPVNTCATKPTVDSGVKGRTATLKFYGDAVRRIAYSACHPGWPRQNAMRRAPPFCLSPLCVRCRFCQGSVGNIQWRLWSAPPPNHECQREQCLGVATPCCTCTAGPALR